jgi:hypothetical protein
MPSLAFQPPRSSRRPHLPCATERIRANFSGLLFPWVPPQAQSSLLDRNTRKVAVAALRLGYPKWRYCLAMEINAPALVPSPESVTQDECDG